MSSDPDCELCEAARFTHWYYEDDVCWIADCEACLVPMVVWKNHSIEPSDEQRAHMAEQLEAAGRVRFGTETFELDDDMRTIPDHFHMHARDANWFGQRMHRRMVRYTGVGTPRAE